MPSSSAPARSEVNRDRLVDTLMLARRKHPGGSNRLDDLCLRYKVDNSRRTKHGALLDAELLAEVYLELIGARQAMLGLTEAMGGAHARAAEALGVVRPQPLPPRVTEEERAAHLAFVETLGDAAIWRQYAPAEKPSDDSASAA